MFFSFLSPTPKQIARKLLSLVTYETKSAYTTITSKHDFSEAEKIRLKGCLSIAYLVTVSWWVNFYQQHKRSFKKTKEILDSLIEQFVQDISTQDFSEDNIQGLVEAIKNRNNPSFTPSTSAIKLNDIVVDPLEIKLVLDEYPPDTSEDILTSYSTIIPILYDIRAEQYMKALNTLYEKVILDDIPHIHPVAHLVYRHFIGTKEDYGLLFTINIAIMASFTVIPSAIKSIL